MRGFIEGLVYVTIIGQVPHLLGINGHRATFSRSFGMSCSICLMSLSRLS
jgi:hypothetical protein